MSKNSVIQEERILPTAVGFQASDSDGNEELGVQPYLYELEDDGSPERRQSDSDDEEHVARHGNNNWKANTYFRLSMSLQIT